MSHQQHGFVGKKHWRIWILRVATDRGTALLTPSQSNHRSIEKPSTGARHPQSYIECAT